MSNVRLITTLFVVLGSAAVAAGCSNSADASLTVKNHSDFAIVELRVTPVGNPSWGPNLLAGDTLEPGESLVLAAECNTYDALLVDESGVDCQVNDVDLCLNDATWVINNDTCAVFGARRVAPGTAPAATPSAPATTAPDAITSEAT
jgi:hypothetical protein